METIIRDFLFYRMAIFLEAHIVARPIIALVFTRPKLKGKIRERSSIITER